MSTPYDKLISLCNEAIASTHEWERKAKRTIWFDRGLIVFNSAFVLFDLWIGMWVMALVMLVLAGAAIYILHRAKKHLVWILETRDRWQTDLEQYQFDRITYVENGYTY